MQIIIGIGLGTLLTLLIVYFITAKYGFKNLFPGSGDPYSMAKALFGIVSFLSQSIVGLSVIVMIITAISMKIITSDVGFPIVTAIVGYLLASNIRDTIFNDKGKKE